MIVKNKEATILMANEIANKIMKTISDDIKKFTCEDDPAEQVYLMIHLISSLLVKSLISLEGYGQTYNIENMTIKSLSKWIYYVTKENLKIYKDDY